MSNIYVIGHQNPDTDSICSAIAYANLKKRLGQKKVIPARAGKINKETQFVLNYFKIDPPELITDVKARVSDITRKNKIVGKAPYVNLRRIWETMQEHNLKTIPITEHDGYFLGLVTLGDLARKYLSIFHGHDQKLKDVTIKNIIKTLDGEIIIGNENKIINGKVTVAAMSPDSVGSYVEAGGVVLVGNRLKTQKAVLNCRPSLMIVTGNYNIAPEVFELAQQFQVAIIKIPHDTYAAARLISMSVPASTIMKNQDLVVFYEDDLIEDVKPVMLETRYRNYPVLDEQHKIVGMLARYDLLALNGKKVILVDHNERSQAVEGIEEAEVLEVIDHHRLGDVQTGEPIYFRNEPVGSTATIIAGLFKHNNLEPEPYIAGLLMAAILSDTMLFKSPTCTMVDILTVEQLAKIANIDAKKFGVEMFKAGTSLEGVTAAELLHKDFKTFQMGELKVGIGQVDSINLDSLLGYKDALIEEMFDKKEKEKFDLVLMMLTDIYNEVTELLFVGDRKDSIPVAFGEHAGKVNGNSVTLVKVLSRKKQIVPILTRFFTG